MLTRGWRRTLFYEDYTEYAERYSKMKESLRSIRRAKWSARNPLLLHSLSVIGLTRLLAVCFVSVSLLAVLGFQHQALGHPVDQSSTRRVQRVDHCPCIWGLCAAVCSWDRPCILTHRLTRPLPSNGLKMVRGYDPRPLKNLIKKKSPLPVLRWF